MGIHLYDLYIWSFSCRILLSVCNVLYHVRCWFCLHFLNWCILLFGGAHALSLSFHVPFLCFFIFKVEIGDNLGVDEWPSEIISSSDIFDPRDFFGKLASV